MIFLNILYLEKESDNYYFVESKIEENNIYWKYKGFSYTSKVSDLIISFNYSSYTINEIKNIEGPDS